jgi:hypothetical protein
VFKVEHLSALTNLTDPVQQVQYAVHFLGETGLLWWRGVEDSRPVWTWQQFKEAFLTAHVAIDPVETARQHLDKLRQGDNTANYYAVQFRNVALQIPTLSEADKIHRFVSGLRPNIAQQVRIQDPDTLEAAMRIAVRAEDPKKTSYTYPNHNNNRSRNNQGNGSTPMELGAMRGQPSSSKLRNKYNLSWQEKQRLFDEGRCYRCKKVGHTSANCTMSAAKRSPTSSKN